MAQPELLGRAVPLPLRGSLGITFVVGALKLAGEPTLPASLIAAITPMVDPGLSVPLVGAFEVVLGAGLLLGPCCRPGWPGPRCSFGTFLVLLAATASLALHAVGSRPVAPTDHRLTDTRDPNREPPPTQEAA